LTTLSRILGGHGACRACGFRRLIRIDQICDRLEDSLSGSKGEAKLFEIGFSQFRQNVSLDFAIAKSTLVLSEAKAT